MDIFKNNNYEKEFSYWLQNIVAREDIFKDYNYEKEYSCSPNVIAKHFNKLMYLIININNIHNGRNFFKEYIRDNENEINEMNSAGWSALMIAVRNSKKFNLLEEIKLLIKKGADINVTNKDGWSSLMLASRYSNENSNIETVKLLINKKADINATNKTGCSSLMIASRFSNDTSNIETVKLLIEKGADVNAKDNEGWTPLMMASRYSNEKSNNETVKLLIENGANINIINQSKVSALLLAAIGTEIRVPPESNLDTIKILIENGANVNVEYNKTFFGYLTLDHSREIINLVSQINFNKFCMKNVMKMVPIKAYKILLNPESFQSQLLAIKWKINYGGSYTELIKENKKLFDYLGIYDDHSLRTKIMDCMKFMD